MRLRDFTLIDLACILTIISVSVSLTASLFTSGGHSFALVSTNTVTAKSVKP